MHHLAVVPLTQLPPAPAVARPARLACVRPLAQAAKAQAVVLAVVIGSGELADLCAVVGALATVHGVKALPHGRMQVALALSADGVTMLMRAILRGLPAGEFGPLVRS